MQNSEVPQVNETVCPCEGSLIAWRYQASFTSIVDRMNYRDDLYRLLSLLRHYHCPDHLGMLRTAVLERSTRREGIAERLPRVEQSALPYVMRGDYYRG